MEFYDETRPLYLKTDISGVGVGAVLMQIRDRLNCPEEEAPQSSILRMIAFVSKCLSSTESRYSNIERGIGNTAWTRDVSAILFYWRCKYYNALQAIGSNL